MSTEKKLWWPQQRGLELGSWDDWQSPRWQISATWQLSPTVFIKETYINISVRQMVICRKNVESNKNFQHTPDICHCRWERLYNRLAGGNCSLIGYWLCTDNHVTVKSVYNLKWEYSCFLMIIILVQFSWKKKNHLLFIKRCICYKAFCLATLSGNPDNMILRNQL